MIVSDNTIAAEGLGDFFKNLGRKRPDVSTKGGQNVLKNPARALEIGANVGLAIGSRSPKAALSTLLEVINFFETVKRFYLGKFV